MAGPSLPVSPMMQFRGAAKSVMLLSSVSGLAWSMKPLFVAPQSLVTVWLDVKTYGASWWSRPSAMFIAKAVWFFVPSNRGLSSCPKFPRSWPTQPTGMSDGVAEAELVGAEDEGTAPGLTRKIRWFEEYSGVLFLFFCTSA